MIKNLRKDIFIYIYIFFDNCVHTRKLHSNGSEKEFLLFTFPCPIFSCFLPPYCQVDKTGGRIKLEERAGWRGLCKPADYYLRATRRRANHLFIKWTIVG